MKPKQVFFSTLIVVCWIITLAWTGNLFFEKGKDAGITETLQKEMLQNPEMQRNTSDTYNYVFQDETFCTVFVITSDLQEPEVRTIVRYLYPETSKIKFISKIRIDEENQELE